MALKYIANGITGIWNSYGCLPEPNKSVSLRIEDVYLEQTSSLKELLGIEGTAKDIGQFSEESEFREAVVLLPMIKDKPDEPINEDEPAPEPAIELDPCNECIEDPCRHKTLRGTRRKKEKTSVLYYSQAEKAYLFRIDEAIINKILDVADYKILNISEIKEILYSRIKFLNNKNNIVRLMYQMVRYNFPPHLNWLLFNKGSNYIPPIVMYVKEYVLSLYKEDLLDIWQGTMPIHALNVQPQQEVDTIEHYLTSEELFGSYDVTKFKNIKLKIFKCKWHGEADYYKLLKQDRNNLAKKQINPNGWYEYNWPHDNYSLIEYIQVQKSEIHDYENDGKNEDGVLDSQYELIKTTDNTLNPSDVTTYTTKLYKTNAPTDLITVDDIKNKDKAGIGESLISVPTNVVKTK